MKPNAIIKEVRHGGLTIGVKAFAGGRFGFDYKPQGGERVRVRVGDVKTAIERAETMLGVAGAGRLDLMAIKPDEFAEFLAWKNRTHKQVLAQDLVKSFLASKEDKGLSFWTLRDLKGTLKSFGDDFEDVPIEDLSRGAVEKWLTKPNVGARRWNNQLSHIIALIRFARRERFISTDLTPVEGIQKRKVVTHIGTYAPDELKKLLAVVPKEWLPAVVLGAFAGLRPEEICPDPKTDKQGLQWENILWEKKKIDVPKTVSKVGRRRFVPLCATLEEFLSDWKGSTGPVVPRKRLANETRHWAEDSGVKWLNDGLRHSYASYRLALLKDIQELSLEMGNSVKVIHDSYLDLKHEDEAQKWFAIRPTKKKKR